MTESLENRLRAIEVTEVSPSARAKAITAARTQASRVERSGSSRRRTGAVVVILVCLFAITPPGVSIATSLGHLVGIGDEPSAPLDLGGGKSDEAVVGLGETPDGVPYELATSDGPVGEDGRETCFYVSLPTVDTPTQTASCLTAAALRGLRRNPIGGVFPVRAPAGLGPNTDLMLAGAAADRVARLEIEYPTPEGSVVQRLELAPFEATPRSVRGVDRSEGKVRLSAFAAFVPFDLRPTVTVGGGGGAPAIEERAELLRREARRYQRQLAEISFRAYGADGNLIAEVSPGDRRGSGMPLAIGVG